jgi:amino acid permease
MGSVNLVTIFGLLTWISILIAHIGFLKVIASSPSAHEQCIKAQGIDRNSLPYRSPLGASGTWFALLFCILVTIFKISPIAILVDLSARFRHNCTNGKSPLKTS